VDRRQSAGWTAAVVSILICAFSASDAPTGYEDRYAIKKEYRLNTKTEHTRAVTFLNQADAEELVTLPGVGIRTAEALLGERERGGEYAFVEDLMSVSGIGTKKFQDILQYLTVNFPESE